MMAALAVAIATQAKHSLNVVRCLAINTFRYEYKCLFYSWFALSRNKKNNSKTIHCIKSRNYYVIGYK